MAKTFSQLPITTTLAASDVLPLEQSTLTKQITVQDAATAIAPLLPAATGTGGLVRQTNPTINGGERIVDSAYPFTQWTNTSAPTDKKRLRAYVESSGVVGLARVNDAENVGTSIIAWDVNNNCGIGTTTPAQKLSVNGNIDCGWAYAQGIGVVNNFPTVASTTASGYGWRFYNTSNGASLGYCIIQGTTDNFASSFIDGFQINTDGSCGLGIGSSAIKNVYTAVATLAPPAIAANGGIQSLDVTVTGATNSMVCMIECPGGLSNNSIILKANFIAADTVRVYFINPTASSVTLTSANYRVVCIKF